MGFDVRKPVLRVCNQYLITPSYSGVEIAKFDTCSRKDYCLKIFLLVPRNRLSLTLTVLKPYINFFKNSMKPDTVDSEIFA